MRNILKKIGFKFLLPIDEAFFLPISSNNSEEDYGRSAKTNFAKRPQFQLPAPERQLRTQL